MLGLSRLKRLRAAPAVSRSESELHQRDRFESRALAPALGSIWVLESLGRAILMQLPSVLIGPSRGVGHCLAVAERLRGCGLSYRVQYLLGDSERKIGVGSLFGGRPHKRGFPWRPNRLAVVSARSMAQKGCPLLSECLTASNSAAGCAHRTLARHRRRSASVPPNPSPSVKPLSRVAAIKGVIDQSIFDGSWQASHGDGFDRSLGNLKMI